MVDTQQQMLYQAPCDEARRFLAAQWSRNESLPVEFTEEEQARLVKEWQEGATLLDWAEHMAEGMCERRANGRLMRLWLNQL